MTLIDKNELIRMLELCESGCEHCRHADNRYRCERGEWFETACSMICDAEEIDEIYGYKIKDIIEIAVLLREERLSPKDVKMALRDIERAIRATMDAIIKLREDCTKRVNGADGERRTE